jgi:hypothetical protein
MLQDARMSAMTRRTAASKTTVGRQQWAENDNDEIEKRSDCCAMQISTRRAESGSSLRVRTGMDNLKKADTQGCDPVFSIFKCSERRL